MIPTKYDKYIQTALQHHFPELLEALGQEAWLWIKAQIWQESSFNPKAVSPVGAKGLMQLMSETAREVHLEDAFDEAENIRAGVTYLAIQFRHLSEIDTTLNRLWFAFAAYNGGRGYVNKALALARVSCGCYEDFYRWKKNGEESGDWQLWDYASEFLTDATCVVHRRHPDAHQMIDYVESIKKRWQRLLVEP